MEKAVKSRPGGRSARVRTSVADAVAELLGERSAGDISMAAIAQRAGVAVTSLYRRWGDLSTLLMDVAVDRLAADWPLPDTGSLEGDLKAWAGNVAASLASGSSFYRIVIATAPVDLAPSAGRTTALMRRMADLDEMLERSQLRGDKVPSAFEILDHVLAPLYWRMLTGNAQDETYAHALVDRLLATSTWNERK
jgi:AcrR family transcriptional regulator